MIMLASHTDDSADYQPNDEVHKSFLASWAC
jgi:hypothetical protein